MADEIHITIDPDEFARALGPALNVLSAFEAGWAAGSVEFATAYAEALVRGHDGVVNLLFAVTAVADDACALLAHETGISRHELGERITAGLGDFEDWKQRRSTPDDPEG